MEFQSALSAARHPYPVAHSYHLSFAKARHCHSSATLSSLSSSINSLKALDLASCRLLNHPDPGFGDLRKLKRIPLMWDSIRVVTKFNGPLLLALRIDCLRRGDCPATFAGDFQLAVAGQVVLALADDFRQGRIGVVQAQAL